MTFAPLDAALAALEQLDGADALGAWAAPGRLNLIGEHTDYTGGLCLPFALPQCAVVAVAPRSDAGWRFATTAPELAPVEVLPDDLAPGRHGWAGYLAGVVWALQRRGVEVQGLDVVVSSDVPLGAGLSSSAALECAMVAALCDLTCADLSPLDRALVAQAAENGYVCAPTGLLDQAASTMCEPGHALLCDFGAEAFEPVPFDPAAHGLEVLVLDTRVEHSHVSGEYADRRRTCEEAQKVVGPLSELAPAGLGEAASLLPDATTIARVRHVVTENDRVRRTVALLRAGDLAGIGPLLDESHASMRDDYEITVPAVDLAAGVMRDHGALGARMTGGGFGGCVVGLVPSGRSEAVAAALCRAYEDTGLRAPSWFTAVPSAGARRLA